jgi:hypothetical protein
MAELQRDQSGPLQGNQGGGLQGDQGGALQEDPKRCTFKWVSNTCLRECTGKMLETMWVQT